MDNQTKRLSIFIPADNYRKAKSAAALLGLTLTEFVNLALVEKAAREANRNRTLEAIVEDLKA